MFHIRNVFYATPKKLSSWNHNFFKCSVKNISNREHVGNTTCNCNCDIDDFVGFACKGTTMD
jgi:hypothetical protein